MGAYDKSSKWLIEHHGDSILRLAGVQEIESWRALQPELVQPTQFPDGLLEVRRTGRADPISLYWNWPPIRNAVFSSNCCATSPW